MLLSQKEIAAELGVSSRTIYNWRLVRGFFPKPVRKNNRRCYWTREQIDKWKGKVAESIGN